MSFFTENQIWKLLQDELALWEATYPDSVIVKRSFQPSQQSTPAGFVAYVFQINNKRYGWQSGSDKFNSGTNSIDHIERYIINKFLQISTQAITDPKALRTSGDVAESIAAWLGSQEVILRLKSQEVEIFRITTIRHPHFTNDLDRYEGDPSFDFILSYTQEIESITPPIDNIDGQLINDGALPPPP